MDIVGVRVEKKKGAKRNASATISYPDKSDPNDPTEKILFESTHINCKSNERMIAHAESSVKLSRSPDTLEHLVFSFASHLKPSREDCELVVKNALSLTGCKDCPAKWTVHQNTENIHIHIVIVRADKNDPSKIVKPSRFIDKINKAAAKSIYQLGLETSANAPFVYDGKNFIRGERKPDEEQISNKAQSFESRTGQKSTERDLKEALFPTIKEVKANPEKWSWPKFHLKMVELGVRIEAAKGGLVFVDLETNQGIKGSQFRFSRKQAESLLGVFQESKPYREPTQPREPTTDYGQFKQLRDAFSNEQRKVLNELRLKFDKELVDLKNAHKEKVRYLRATGATMIDIAFAEADFGLAKQTLRARKTEANRIAKESKFASWVDYKKMHGLVDADFDPIAPKRIQLSEIYAEAQAVQVERTDIRHFKARPLPTGTEYSSRADNPAFVDVGSKIIIHASQDDDTLLASLQLAVAKWPSGFTLNGSDQFKRRCIEIAFDEGFAHKINLPETQQIIDEIKAQRKADLTKQREREAAERAAQTARKTRPDVPVLTKGLPDEYNPNQGRFFKNVQNCGKLSVPSMHRSDDNLPSPIQRRDDHQRRRESVLRDYAPRHRQPTDPLLKPAEADRLTQSEKLRLLAETLGCDRFRVCSEKTWHDEQGNFQNEWRYFGDRDKTGQYKAIALDTIERRLPDFKTKWQTAQKQSFALEPLSDTHSHIVLSGLLYSDIEKMSADGFRPSLVIENEPHKFQVVLSLPRQAEDERENQRIERELQSQLQNKYGTGEAQKLAFAGFENHRHRTPNGTFQTRLYRAEKRDCPALLDLARSLKNPENAENQPLSYPSDSSEEQPEADLRGQKSADLAYSYFQNDLTALGWSISEVDQEAATRLLAIGFTVETIKTAIQTNRAGHHEGAVKYDWDLYVERTLERVTRTQSERIDSLAYSHLSKWKDALGLPQSSPAQKLQPDLEPNTWEAPKI